MPEIQPDIAAVGLERDALEAVCRWQNLSGGQAARLTDGISIGGAEEE